MKTKEAKKEVKKEVKNSVRTFANSKRANESLPTFIEFIYSINLKNLTR